MGSSTWVVWMLLVLFTGLMGSLEANEFKVGGNQGWVLNPSENYNQWSARMRFQVNDTIFFKYGKGTDSVLVVNKQDYDTCNTQNPIMKMDGGDSVFKFDRSGPFYFISGNKDNCDKGQKLPVVVIAVRNSKKPTPPPTPPPVAQPPATSPTQASPPSPATAPFPAGETPATSPTPGSSTGSPSPATMKSPTPATSPVSPSPATVESPTPAKSPATSPVSPSPATVESPTPAKSPATSPVSPSPATVESPPPASTTLSPGMTPAESDTAPNPSSNTAEPPPPSSTPAFTPPVFLVLLVTLLSSVALGSFVASPWENMDIF